MNHPPRFNVRRDVPRATLRLRRTLLSSTVCLAALLSLTSCAGTVRPPHPPATPPAGTVLDKVLALYPSAHLPPVSDPYIFYSDSGPLYDYPATVINARGAANRMRRGQLPVSWAYGPQWPYGHTKQDFVKYYLGSIHPDQAILIDEWQAPQLGVPKGSPLASSDPYGIEGAVEGIAQATQKYPGSLTLIAWRGENSLLPLVKRHGVGYILIEAYTNMDKSVPRSWSVSTFQVDLRIWKARRWGMITRTIPWLGEFFPPDRYRPGDVLTVKELEGQIRHYREIAPEMPGLAFYAGKKDSVLAHAANELATKYFIEPAPHVSITSPTRGATLSPAPHTIHAKAEAKDGRRISEYKGFIDNALVYVGSRPSFTWDFSKEAAGSHVITIHAIDSGWNRAAAQISVKIE